MRMRISAKKRLALDSIWRHVAGYTSASMLSSFIGAPVLIVVYLGQLIALFGATTSLGLTIAIVTSAIWGSLVGCTFVFIYQLCGYGYNDVAAAFLLVFFTSVFITYYVSGVLMVARKIALTVSVVFTIARLQNLLNVDNDQVNHIIIWHINVVSIKQLSHHKLQSVFGTSFPCALHIHINIHMYVSYDAVIMICLYHF
jgi:hypothetical protein